MVVMVLDFLARLAAANKGTENGLVSRWRFTARTSSDRRCMGSNSAARDTKSCRHVSAVVTGANQVLDEAQTDWSLSFLEVNGENRLLRSIMMSDSGLGERNKAKMGAASCWRRISAARQS